MSRIMCHVEYTDTFGGEANYAWVKRNRFVFSDQNITLSDDEAKAKALDLMELTGLDGEWSDYGEMMQFTPTDSNTTMFVTFG